ncbi:FUSC family protein [Gephyromycinifex aptenodytis]|uniref:FUSC family protein n=1 Tax=Gephyromycinifex aptenodytis TaxID=2716227 RepID=UPI001445601B|nr:hypothetical protein [Gephyromycinifex aptenodytis]
MLIFLFALALIPSMALATALGAGSAAIVGGMVAFFALISFMAGPLRRDLRLALMLAPIMTAGAVLPRLVAEASRPAGIALAVVVVGVAALLPLWGRHLTSAGTGLGMSSLFAFGFAPTTTTSIGQLLVAAISGFVTAVLVRILLGLADPSKPTRAATAALLDAKEPAVGEAFDLWLADGRPHWIGEVMSAATRFRRAAHAAGLAAHRDDAATQEGLNRLSARAQELAGLVRAKDPAKVPAATAADVATPDSDTPAYPPGLENAARALDLVEEAARNRDRTRVPLENSERAALREALLRPAPTLGSIHVRHAIRTALGLLVMLILTSHLEHGDPLIPTTLMTTFGILQASWAATLDKARPRIIGLLFGSLGVWLLLVIVPQPLLTPISAAALLLGLGFVTSRPALGYAFMVLVSVGLNSATRHLDPYPLLGEYAVLIALSVLVGVVGGFTVIPSLRTAPLAQRVEEARGAAVQLLHALAAGQVRGKAHILGLQREALHAQLGLVPDHESLTDEQAADLETLRVALRDLGALATSAHLSSPVLTRAATCLTRASDVAAPASALEGKDAESLDALTLVSLAEEAHAAHGRLLAELG